MFTGAAELLGGVLLMVPRTVLLGSLVCFADLVMVVTLNLCFDVHVKLFSLHLLFMAFLLIVPDIPRLTRLFLLNRPVQPAVTPSMFARPRLDRIPHILLFLFGVYWIGAPLTDPQRWRWVTFQYAEVMSVELAIGSDQRYAVDVDMPRKRIILAKTRWAPERGVVKDAAGHPVKEPGWQAELAFDQPTPEDLVLDGLLDGHRLHAKLSKIAQLRDNFRWIIVLPKEPEEGRRGRARRLTPAGERHLSVQEVSRCAKLSVSRSCSV